MNKVYIIGAGPGSPGLITVRGLEILREADVIIYDYLVDKRLLEEAKEGAELVCCDTLGKNRYSDGFLVHNEKINRLVVKRAKDGKRVIRLKNGDSSIFSRLSQELDSLVKNRIDFEIVPGVTAASAAACLSGIPLTDRSLASSCVFVTGHEDPAKKRSSIDWGKIAGAGTIVFYMAVENVKRIAEELVRAGKSKDTGVAIVENAALPSQKISVGTLGDIAAKAKRARVRPPAIVIVGEVVKLERRFNWLRKTKRILFTGLSKERFFMNGAYFHLPTIKIEPMADDSQFDNHLRNIKAFDWIVFSSRYGVEYFFKRLKHIGLDVRTLKGIKIASIGSSTARSLSELGIVSDLVPKEESSEGLLKEFGRVGVRGRKLFLPRSDISDKHLSDGFAKLGAKVTTSFAYRNVPAGGLPDLNLGWFDEVMFTSPSGVRNFISRYGALPKGVKPSFIGDVTLKEGKRCRLLG